MYVFDDHHQEGQLDSQLLFGVGRTRDEVRRDIGAHNLEHRGLDVLISESFDVSVANLLVPDLKGLAPESGKVVPDGV